MRRYTILRANRRVPLTGKISTTVWQDACVLKIDKFPWYTKGQKQGTTVRLLYDNDAVYAQFRCRDRHIYAKYTKLNSHVCRDSCVEFFATIEPEKRPDFFNLEINCCGTMLAGFGLDRYNRKDISPGLASQIQVVTSEPGPMRQESPDDRSWWVAVRIPFATLGKFSGAKAVKPKKGDLWQANFYRCGGKTDDQYGCWSPVGTAAPDYHQPDYFSQLIFA